MLDYTTHFLRGLRVWKFLWNLFYINNNVELGLRAAQLVRDVVLEDPGARVRHSHGPRGSDIETARTQLEVKLKLYLLSNKNGIVDGNVAQYKQRGDAETGIIFVTPVAFPNPLTTESTEAKDIYNLGEIVILVVHVTHEVGEKPQITAKHVIEEAKEAIAREYPGREYAELNREELIPLLAIRGMRALDEEIEAVDAKVDGVDAKVDGVDAKVDGVDAKVDGLESKFERLDSKVDRLESTVTSKMNEMITLLKESRDQK